MSLTGREYKTSLLDKIGTGLALDAYVVGATFLKEEYSRRLSEMVE